MEKTPDRWFVLGCGHHQCHRILDACVRSVIADRTAEVTWCLIPQGAGANAAWVLQLCDEYDSDQYPHMIVVTSQHCPEHVGTQERIALQYALEDNLHAARLIGDGCDYQMFDLRVEPRGLLGYSRVWDRNEKE